MPAGGSVSPVLVLEDASLLPMPSRLQRHYGYGHMHFVTFSCDERRAYLADAAARDLFLDALEKARVSYGFEVDAYVVMPEHVHLLLGEPPEDELSAALQALKISVARRSSQKPFWLPRYHGFNVFSAGKTVEKRRYIHRNPVVRGLVSAPEEWAWSSYRQWAFGETGVVKVETERVARERWEKVRG